MRLDLNSPVMLPTGKPATDITRTLGQMLSTFICQSSDDSPIKLWGWAIKLEANEAIELDSADKELLKGWVTGSKVITNLFKGQILQKIIDQSE